MTRPRTGVSFAFTRELAGDITLSRKGKPLFRIPLDRRKFLIGFSQCAGVAMIPSPLWRLPGTSFLAPRELPRQQPLVLHPHYRSERPVDATLLKVDPARDRFPTEQFADEIAAILAQWSVGLTQTPPRIDAMASSLANSFSGASLKPKSSRELRSSQGIAVHENLFAGGGDLNAVSFLRDWQEQLAAFTKIHVAEFQVTEIDAPGITSSAPSRITTHIRYELVGSGSGFHREQRIGTWRIAWERFAGAKFHAISWEPLNETQSRAVVPIYEDFSAAAFGHIHSYTAQMLHGTDYWRTMIDGASGIDIYGHNGVSVADIDNDGFDDLYICQPAGLPNRLYRNRGDGTFEDITESSGLGILENTACALFADFRNEGRQDVILVRTSGPSLYVNDGRGKFRLQPDAFHFAAPPQGTFTGAAVADYDRDGWLDIYFCLYSYYQGTGQYKYPSPYHDAENGPPNFLMRNHRDGSFHDVTDVSGLNQNNTRYSFCCGWSDFNGDGWPDLYVVNDFGRKNLYRNNGDGTFTDTATINGTEDVGAGMSVSWLDYDNDGAPDLYVANMWTAAGLRVSLQEIFKSDSAPPIRALYRKHAMGNSLLHNRDTSFEDKTGSSGTGVGRWSWSSDAFDFDHDGFPDLYIANGMVSGPSRADLNSFFWRQVVANSPDRAGASHAYELGWNAINELIRSDETWSGYERNVFYGNNRDGTFSDLSGIVGLDFLEDGRSFALGDFDHDGRLDIILKNRNAPQLRLLKNVMPDLPPSIVFRLQGTSSNRDAVGASVTIRSSAGQQARTLQAGSGFLSQHSKEIFFGLGKATGGVHATIRWPGGLVQELRDLPINSRVWVVEGSNSTRKEPFAVGVKKSAVADKVPTGESLPDQVETWLLAPVPAPDFSLPDPSGKAWQLSALRGKPILLLFLQQEEPGSDDVKVFLRNAASWAKQGLQVIVANVGSDARSGNRFASSGVLVLRGSEDFAAVYNILFRQLFDRHRDMPLPTSFLIDADGNIVKIYQGPIAAEHVASDFKNIPRSDAERLQRGLPFPATQNALEFGRNHLSFGALFFQRGYLDPAESFFQQALREDPSSAEALYGVGSVYLNQNKNAAANEAFERCVKLKANYPETLPDAWNNLGVLATRENRVPESIDLFQHALTLNPNHLLALDNLGNAYRSLKRWDDARKVLERAVEVAPEDAEANYSLGMVFAQTDQPQKALDHLQRALQARPVYPEALNNLGILYLVTQRKDEAISSFEQCIRVAPTFDQAYLNLARVYALEDAHDKARAVLQDLLKQHPDHPEAKKMLDQLR